MIQQTSIGAAGSRALRSGSALACSLVLLVTLSACGGGGGSSSPPPPPPPPPTYTVGGTVMGLTGTGLVLQNNGGNNLTVNANGAFTFTTAITSGTAYAVTVLTQPSGPAQDCSVTSGSGTVGANVTNVAVSCVVAPTYTVGGTVSGLTGTGLVLRNNGGDDLNVGADGAFVFGTALVTGSNYAVTVFAQPTGQDCTVTNATGAIAGAQVTNIAVSCLVASTWNGIRQFGSAANDSLAVLAVDPTGGVVVGGVAGTIAGAQGAAAGSYVAKYDATGARLWLYFFPAALTAINGVGVDAAGRVYVAGTVTGTFGGTSTNSAIVLKLAVGPAPGYAVSIDWAREFGTANVDVATGLAVDAGGNGTVVGYSAIGTSDDGFLQRFTDTGTLFGFTTIDVPAAAAATHVRPRAVAFDSGGYFIVGDTTTSIEPGQTGTMFLRRYDLAGTYVGTTQFDLGVPRSIAIGAGTRLHVSGTVGTAGTASSDGYLASFDRGTGAETAAARKVFSSVGGIDEARGVGTADNGDVYVTGQTQAGINGHSTGGIPNAYLVKLDPDQNILWTRHFGGSVDTAGRAVGVMLTFGAFVAGVTNGSLPGNTTAGVDDAFIALYDADGNLR